MTACSLNQLKVTSGPSAALLLTLVVGARASLRASGMGLVGTHQEKGVPKQIPSVAALMKPSFEALRTSLKAEAIFSRKRWVPQLWWWKKPSGKLFL